MHEITKESTKNQIVENIIESGLQNKSKSVLMKNYKRSELIELLGSLEGKRRKTVAEQTKKDALAGKQINVLDIVNESELDTLVDINEEIESAIEAFDGDEKALDESLTRTLSTAKPPKSLKSKRRRPVTKDEKGKSSKKPIKFESGHVKEKPIKKDDSTPKALPRPVRHHLASQMKSVRGTMRSYITRLGNDTESESLQFTFYTGNDVQNPKNVLAVELAMALIKQLDPSGEEIEHLMPAFKINGENFNQYVAYKVVREHFNL